MKAVNTKTTSRLDTHKACRTLNVQFLQVTPKHVDMVFNAFLGRLKKVERRKIDELCMLST